MLQLSTLIPDIVDASTAHTAAAAASAVAAAAASAAAAAAVPLAALPPPTLAGQERSSWLQNAQGTRAAQNVTKMRSSSPQLPSIRQC
jgi:hypothetical protein